MENFNNYLSDFVHRINELEDVLLSLHNLEKPFYKNAGKIPKTGTIVINSNEISYNIHGAGCTFEYETGIILDYDYISIMETLINFSPWKFIRFLNTVQSEKEYSQEFILPHLENFVNDNLLIRHPEGYYLYGVVQK